LSDLLWKMANDLALNRHGRPRCLKINSSALSLLCRNANDAHRAGKAQADPKIFVESEIRETRAESRWRRRWPGGVYRACIEGVSRDRTPVGVRRERRLLEPPALVYNVSDFLVTLAMPEPIKGWQLTSLKDKSIMLCAKVVSQGRYVALQLAEVAIPKNLFADILRLIAELRRPPVTSTA
jgi:hypothetical protein